MGTLQKIREISDFELILCKFVLVGLIISMILKVALPSIKIISTFFKSMEIIAVAFLVIGIALWIIQKILEKREEKYERP